MKRMLLVALVVAAVGLVCTVGEAQAQSKATYEPLVNGQMADRGLWDAWVTEYNALSGRQKAEVVRRHMKMCLASFDMTDAQRALVREMMAKHVTAEAYGETDPDKRRDYQYALQQDAAKAEVVLGTELYRLVFFAKPPIEVLQTVKNDPAFK